MKTIFLLASFIYSVSGLCQQSVKGLIVDSKTGLGVPYVNIGLLGTVTGTVSADDGSFMLDIPKGSNNMVVSSIGYENQQLVVSGGEDKLMINLKPASYIFESIDIVASKLKGSPKIYGLKSEKRGNSIGYGGNFLGAEMASVIVIKEPTYLKTANFVINHAKGDSMFFRVKVYDFKDGVAGDNLLKENVIIADEQKKGLLTVDLSNLDLVVYEDVLLSLEWIKGDGDKGNESLSFNSKKRGKKRGVFLRFSNVANFERIDFIKNYKPTFYFTGFPYDAS